VQVPAKTRGTLDRNYFHWLQLRSNCRRIPPRTVKTSEYESQPYHDDNRTRVAIIAGTKKIEYRRIKPYWMKRFEKVSVPFELRLLNGMNPPVPEVTVLILRITKDGRTGEYRLQSSGIQTLGQAAAEAQTVSAASFLLSLQSSSMLQGSARPLGKGARSAFHLSKGQQAFASSGLRSFVIRFPHNAKARWEYTLSLLPS
jgi:hypothetical protein